MTTQAEKTELQDRIDAAYKLINGLEKEVAAIEVEEPVKSGQWIPQIGEGYESITGQGSISTNVRGESGTIDGKINYGNVYPVGKAQAIADQRFAEVRVINRLREIEQGDAVDWRNSSQVKYYPVYDHEDLGVFVPQTHFMQSCNPSWYTTDPDVWPKIIKEMEEDVKAMLWCGL